MGFGTVKNQSLPSSDKDWYAQVEAFKQIQKEILDPDRVLRYDKEGDPINAKYITNPEWTAAKEALKVDVPAFKPTTQIGTEAYSKELAGYLNELSIPQLASLDMDISGLARQDLDLIKASDLKWGSNYLGERDPIIDLLPSDMLHNVSKYRNVGREGDAGAGGEYGGGILKFPTGSQGHDDGPMYDEVGLWQTRNEEGGSDYLYKYKDKELVPLEYRPHKYDSGFAKFAHTAIPIGIGLLATAGIASVAAPAFAGAAGTAGGVSDMGAVGAEIAAGTGGATAGTTAAATGSLMGPVADLAGAEALANGGAAGGYAGATSGAGATGFSSTLAKVGKGAKQVVGWGNVAKTVTGMLSPPSQAMTFKSELGKDALSYEGYTGTSMAKNKFSLAPTYDKNTSSKFNTGGNNGLL